MFFLGCSMHIFILFEIGAIMDNTKAYLSHTWDYDIGSFKNSNIIIQKI
jgi:hypothetical protein